MIVKTDWDEPQCLAYSKIRCNTHGDMMTMLDLCIRHGVYPSVRQGRILCVNSLWDVRMVLQIANQCRINIDIIPHAGMVLDEKQERLINRPRNSPPGTKARDMQRPTA